MNIKHIPNLITSLRFVGSISLLFFSLESPVFRITYLLCGISDMIDGHIARRLNATTETGALLDSIADLCMISVCAIKLIPIISALPYWIWIWIGAIALIKVANIISSIVYLKKVVFPHTAANKITGLLIFIALPLLFFYDAYAVYPTGIVCIIATFAAIQEGHYIRTRC